MGIGATRDALSHIFYQRCFWLFAMLLVLIGAVSFVPATDHGRLFVNARKKSSTRRSGRPRATTRWWKQLKGNTSKRKT